MSSLVKDDLTKSKFSLTEIDLELKVDELNEFIILSAGNNDYNKYNNVIYNENLNLKIEFCKYLTSALKIIQKQKEEISKNHIELLELKIEIMQIKEELNNKNIMRHCMK